MSEPAATTETSAAPEILSAPPATAPPAADFRSKRLLGFLLLLPALALLAVSYVIPTFWTVRASFTDYSFFDDEAVWVGTENYAVLANVGFGDALRFALSIVVWPVLTITVVALLVAYFANRAGRFARWAVRVALALPMVAFAPTAFAAAWRLDRTEPGDAAAETIQSLVRSAVGLTMFGLLVGVGVVVYLATLNRREQTRPGAATLVAGVLAVIATIAVGLQIWTYPSLLSTDVPATRAATTPLMLMQQLYLSRLDFAAASTAVASALLGILAVLGVLAVVLAIATNLRIEVSATRRRGTSAGGTSAGGDDPPERVRPAVTDGIPGSKVAARHAEAVIGTMLATLVVLAVTGYGLWPWLSRLFRFLGTDHAFDEYAETAGRVMAGTWVPPLVGVAVGMIAAGLAGFAIGALRPLGRFSPLLLLVFAPWLFVGTGVLTIYGFDWRVSQGWRTSFLATIPPGWVVVPAVILFALLFQGQRARWQELREEGVAAGPATVRAMLLPALPMLWLVGGAAWLVHAQSLTWGVFTRNLWWPTGPAFLRSQLNGPDEAATDLGFGLTLPFFAILVLAGGLAVLQVTYLDRVAIRVGRPGR